MESSGKSDSWRPGGRWHLQVNTRKMKMKYTMRGHTTIMRVNSLANPETSQCCQMHGSGKTGALVYCWQECKNMQPSQKPVWKFPHLKWASSSHHVWLHTAKFTILDIPKRCESVAKRYLGTCVHNNHLDGWGRSNTILVICDWINKIWYVPPIEYYSAPKRKGSMTCGGAHWSQPIAKGQILCNSTSVGDLE